MYPRGDRTSALPVASRLPLPEWPTHSSLTCNGPFVTGRASCRLATLGSLPSGLPECLFIPAPAHEADTSWGISVLGVTTACLWCVCLISSFLSLWLSVKGVRNSVGPGPTLAQAWGSGVSTLCLGRLDVLARQCPPALLQVAGWELAPEGHLRDI